MRKSLYSTRLQVIILFGTTVEMVKMKLIYSLK